MKITLRLIVLGLLPLFIQASCKGHRDTNDSRTLYAVYEGVNNYGAVEKEDKDNFVFRFHADGVDRSYKLPAADGTYAWQNTLKEGGRVRLTLTEDKSGVEVLQVESPVAQGSVTAVSDSEITIDGEVYPLAERPRFCHIRREMGGSVTEELSGVSVGDRVKVYGSPVKFVDRTFVAEAYRAPVQGTPGLRTVKNLLQTALSACGTVLYVYGGAWNWQDAGSSPQARTIGIPQDWIEFFQMNDASYQYKAANPAVSYYPWKGYNEYYFAGADCSGFIGWNVYNVMNTADGEEGYVISSDKFARNLADNHGYGTFSKDNRKEKFLPGDIVSMSGHVWVCVGRAKDGSLLIIHSTVDSTDERFLKGSGIQLSGLNEESKDCKATELARHYMQTYYPQWSERYQAITKDFATYTDFGKKETLGKFSWHISFRGLTDPDGYLGMSAEEILCDLFAEDARR